MENAMSINWFVWGLWIDVRIKKKKHVRYSDAWYIRRTGKFKFIPITRGMYERIRIELLTNSFIRMLTILKWIRSITENEMQSRKQKAENRFSQCYRSLNFVECERHERKFSCEFHMYFRVNLIEYTKKKHNCECRK